MVAKRLNVKGNCSGEDVARTLGEQRCTNRAGSFRRAGEAHGSFARRSGIFSIGRDRNGRPTQTKSQDGVRFLIDKWFVRLSFKREDESKLKGVQWKELEQTLKKSDVARKSVVTHTHVLTAVRALMHVNDSYAKEIDATEVTLSALDQLTGYLAEDVKSKHPDDVIRIAIHQLQEFDTNLSKKKCALKKVVARARLDQTIKMLEDALAMDFGSRERDFQISRALAKLTSVRSRLGEWRDRTVAGIFTFTKQREYCLRVERDKWLLGQLARFAEIPEQVSQFIENDRKNKVPALKEFGRLLGKRKKNKDAILTYIQQQSEIFRVSQRERQRAEDQIALTEHGRLPMDGVKRDIQIGHLGWLYRYVKKEDYANAKRKLADLWLFVSANKPKFILGELEKTDDSYLCTVLSSMRIGTEAFERKDFAEARRQFSMARDVLEIIISPRQ
ncbi:MAG: hypothetical protein ABII22_06435 [Candidatus Micrarchaeota archaeon]